MPKNSKTNTSGSFPPWLYTKFSNATLEAMMRQGEHPRQRLIACMARNSWGYGRDFVVKGGRAATLVEIAEWLQVTKQFISREFQSMEADGWARRVDPGLYYLNHNPEAHARAMEEIQVERPADFPTEEQFITLKDPKYFEEETVWHAGWNTLRARRRRLHNTYFEVLEKRLRGEDCTVDLTPETESTVQEENPVVQLGEQGGTVDRILIDKKKERKKGVPTPVSECNQIRNSLTHWFGFVLAETDTIPQQLAQLAAGQNLAIEELGSWMEAKAHSAAKRRKPVTSAGAVLSFAHTDLAPWAKQNAAKLDARRQQIANPPPERQPEPELTREEQLAYARAELSAEKRPLYRLAYQTRISELEAEIYEANPKTKGAGGD